MCRGLGRQQLLVLRTLSALGHPGDGMAWRMSWVLNRAWKGPELKAELSKPQVSCGAEQKGSKRRTFRPLPPAQQRREHGFANASRTFALLEKRGLVMRFGGKGSATVAITAAGHAFVATASRSGSSFGAPKIRSISSSGIESATKSHQSLSETDGPAHRVR